MVGCVSPVGIVVLLLLLCRASHDPVVHQQKQKSTLSSVTRLALSVTPSISAHANNDTNANIQRYLGSKPVQSRAAPSSAVVVHGRAFTPGHFGELPFTRPPVLLKQWYDIHAIEHVERLDRVLLDDAVAQPVNMDAYQLDHKGPATASHIAACICFHVYVPL